MRNLKRLVSAGIRCPDPIEVRENVLVMTFVGDKEGWYDRLILLVTICNNVDFRASPRLKDAQLTAAECAGLYAELVLTVRIMFHQCKLVHADLSEYNILYHEGHLWIIDVSQSVEQDHPAAFDFLRNDIKNVEEFFGRLGVKCLGIRRCFEFITKDKLFSDGADGEDENILGQWLQETDDQDSSPSGDVDGDPREGSSVHEDSVFLKSFIPRSLNEVYDPERDVARINRGDGDGLIYANTIGLVSTVPESEAVSDIKDDTEVKVRFKECDNAGISGSADDETEGEASDLDDEERQAKDGFEERTPRGHRHEDREAKKASFF